MAYTTINKSTDYFNNKIYTGNGSTNAITGVGHQPDLVWIKSRTEAHHHRLFDAVRGATKKIFSSQTNAESTDAGSLTSFDADGFTHAGGDTDGNGNGQSYASWNWKANGTGSANTDGSISSTVSANTTSGFSIVKYTGNGTNNATVGHALNATPKLLIGKCLGTVSNWQVVGNFGSLTEGKYLILNEPNAIGTSSNVSFDASATTVKFQGGQGLNISGQPHIAYCFADVTGYSKFGTYYGNGSTDGTFIYTGFKPAWVMVHALDSAQGWWMFDNKRDNDGNAIGKRLGAERTDSEATGDKLDFVSNGFKWRDGDNAWNYASGHQYIYMCFAEAPLVGSNGVTAKAR